MCRWKYDLFQMLNLSIFDDPIEVGHDKCLWIFIILKISIFFVKLFLKPFSHFHHHLSSQTLITIQFLGEMKKKTLLGKKLLKVFYPLILSLPSPRFRLFSHISFMSKRRLWEGLWFSVNSTSFLPPFGFSKSFLPH